MKRTLTLLAAATALAAAFGAPAVSAMRAVLSTGVSPALAPSAETAPIITVDDDGEGEGFWIFGGSHDDDGYQTDGCDDEEGDDGACAGGQPAAAGTVAPPANGLFTDGATPQVQQN